MAQTAQQQVTHVFFGVSQLKEIFPLLKDIPSDTLILLYDALIRHFIDTCTAAGLCISDICDVTRGTVFSGQDYSLVYEGKIVHMQCSFDCIVSGIVPKGDAITAVHFSRVPDEGFVKKIRKFFRQQDLYDLCIMLDKEYGTKLSGNTKEFYNSANTQTRDPSMNGGIKPEYALWYIIKNLNAVIPCDMKALRNNLYGLLGEFPFLRVFGLTRNLDEDAYSEIFNAAVQKLIGRGFLIGHSLDCDEVFEINCEQMLYHPTDEDVYAQQMVWPKIKNACISIARELEAAFEYQ